MSDRLERGREVNDPKSNSRFDSVDAGTVTVDGKTSRDKIAFVPDLQTMPSYMTIGQALTYMADHYPDWNQETAERLLETFQLFTTDKMANLSKGNKAKFNLVLGFALDRPYILLDEPLAGIDLFMKEQIAWIFSSEFMEGRSILMTTHEIAEVEQVIDRVLFLRTERSLKSKRRMSCAAVIINRSRTGCGRFIKDETLVVINE